MMGEGEMVRLEWPVSFPGFPAQRYWRQKCVGKFLQKSGYGFKDKEVDENGEIKSGFFQWLPELNLTYAIIRREEINANL